MKRAAALLVALLSLPGLFPATASAATAYVSDELILGVFAAQNGQGERLATLHSGASVDTLAVSGEFTQVRLNDGTTGWVKSTYLTTREPATSRLKQLEEELDRRRATTPALAEAAARSEVEHLKLELAAKRAEIDAGAAVRATDGAAPSSELAASAPMPAQPAESTYVARNMTVSARSTILATVVAMAVGFWLGYATLARRVRHKFGGIKVY